MDREDVCDLTLDAATASEFEMAVDQQVRCIPQLFRALKLIDLRVIPVQYWYELFLDDLPMWGMVGEVLRDETHGKMEKVNLPIIRL